MAIDAKVEYVSLDEDGSGYLRLVDRPAPPGIPPGIAGQGRLFFQSAPPDVGSLMGLNIWGGSDFIMLGNIEIARRKEYSYIVFHDAGTFQRAIREYPQRGPKVRPIS